MLHDAAFFAKVPVKGFPVFNWLNILRLECLFLFDLILYVHSTIFQLCGTDLPGLDQY